MKSVADVLSHFDGEVPTTAQLLEYVYYLTKVSGAGIREIRRRMWYITQAKPLFEEFPMYCFSLVAGNNILSVTEKIFIVYLADTTANQALTAIMLSGINKKLHKIVFKAKLSDYDPTEGIIAGYRLPDWAAKAVSNHYYVMLSLEEEYLFPETRPKDTATKMYKRNAERIRVMYGYDINKIATASQNYYYVETGELILI